MPQLKPQLPPALSKESEIHDAMVELFQGLQQGVVAEPLFKITTVVVSYAVTNLLSFK